MGFRSLLLRSSVETVKAFFTSITDRKLTTLGPQHHVVMHDLLLYSVALILRLGLPSPEAISKYSCRDCKMGSMGKDAGHSGLTT